MNFFRDNNEKWFWLIALITLMLIGYSQLPIIAYILTAALFVYAIFNPKYAILLLFVYIPIREFVTAKLSTIQANCMPQQKLKHIRTLHVCRNCSVKPCRSALSVMKTSSAM